ncbi:MAG: YlxR family protein, partial [Lachnospiraceae bacterium]|nr:YlxR family protein [Lachnospiraceae bacterium]
MAQSKRIPLRKCVGCQEMKSKKELLRIVLTPEGQILFDPTGRMNGRGAYVCPKDACLEMAVKNGGLSRSFKM